MLFLALEGLFIHDKMMRNAEGVKFVSNSVIVAYNVS